jgi:hypothetical protein
MSFLSKANSSPLGFGLINKVDPVNRAASSWVASAFAPKTPPPPPGVPNPNDAANAAQATTDAMRMRRGMLANIYAGASGSAPVVGKTQLGT